MANYRFDPAEDAWIAYMKAAQDDRVVTSVPKTRPARFIQLERVGGTSGIASDDALMVFTCWDVSRTAAAQYATDVLQLVKAATALAGRPINRLRVISEPLYRPDPISGVDRYQFTIQARIRGKFPTPSP